MPAPRGLVRAARENLSEFEQRVRRRPGLGGAAACLVVPIVVMNFLVNGPENVWCRGVAVVGLLIVITWGHAGFQRTCGFNSLPASSAFAYEVAFTSRVSSHEVDLPAFRSPGDRFPTRRRRAGSCRGATGTPVQPASSLH